MEKNESQLHIRSYELGVLLVPSLIGPITAAPFSCTPDPSPARCLGALRPPEDEGVFGRTDGSLVELVVEAEASRGSIGEDARSSSKAEATTTSQHKAVFRAVVPLPYPLPPTRYGAHDTPWVWDIRHKNPDDWGRYDCRGGAHYGLPQD